MCFSAGASFGAGAVLGLIGVASLKKVIKPSQIMFAGIPLVFSIQQVCEGVLWLSLTHSDLNHWQRVLTYLFLFFAQVLWPTWVPLSMLLLENEKKKKIFLWIISSCGILVSMITAYRLMAYPVLAEIKGHHIYYDLLAPHIFTIISSVLYFIATILPGFASSVERMRLLAIFLLSSLIFSRIFYELYFISVWCFFSAIISSFVFYMVKNFQKVSVYEKSVSRLL